MPPPDDTNNEITRLLRDLREGNTNVRNRLADIVYAQMKRIASGQLRRERTGHTLQPTALVNEAYLRLVRADVDWQNRAHFFAIAAQVMRRILVDYAKKRGADKRGGDCGHVHIEDVVVGNRARPIEFLALDEALGRLKHLDERQSNVVEMKFFGGMSEDEIGEVLGVHARTVKRDWAFAKAWLYGELNR